MSLRDSVLSEFQGNKTEGKKRKKCDDNKAPTNKAQKKTNTQKRKVDHENTRAPQPGATSSSHQKKITNPDNLFFQERKSYVENGDDEEEEEEEEARILLSGIEREKKSNLYKIVTIQYDILRAVNKTPKNIIPFFITTMKDAEFWCKHIEKRFLDSVGVGRFSNWYQVAKKKFVQMVDFSDGKNGFFVQKTKTKLSGDSEVFMLSRDTKVIIFCDWNDKTAKRLGDNDDLINLRINVANLKTQALPPPPPVSPLFTKENVLSWQLLIFLFLLRKFFSDYLDVRLEVQCIGDSSFSKYVSENFKDAIVQYVMTGFPIILKKNQ